MTKMSVRKAERKAKKLGLLLVRKEELLPEKWRRFAAQSLYCVKLVCQKNNLKFSTNLT